MSATPATATTQTANGTSCEQKLHRAAAAVAGYAGASTIADHTFLAWCAMPAVGGGLAAVAHALYYLPHNFMIMLPQAVGSRLAGMVKGSAIADRIHCYNPEGSSHDEPSLMVDAVIADETDVATDGRAPIVVVEPGYPGLTANKRGYTVGRNPEAIASALLKISRA